MTIVSLLLIGITGAVAPPPDPSIRTTGEPTLEFLPSGPPGRTGQPALAYEMTLRASCGPSVFSMRMQHRERVVGRGPLGVAITSFTLMKGRTLQLSDADFVGDLTAHAIVGAQPDCTGDDVIGLNLLLAPHDDHRPFERRYFQFEDGEVSFTLTEAYTSLERLRFVYR